MKKIDPSLWNSLASKHDNPFISWEWLYALEESGSMTAESGWKPWIALVQEDTALIAGAVFWEKSHSFGEFVFDFAWAEAAEKLGILYYPKLVAVIPATPSPVYEFLLPQEEAGMEISKAELLSFILDETQELCKREKLSGLSILFPNEQFRELMDHKYQSCGIGGDETLLPQFGHWDHHGYLWENENFKELDNFLETLNKNQRRNIRREIKSIEEGEFEIRVAKAVELPEIYAEYMYDFYSSTNDKFYPWDARYLNKDFFKLAHREAGEHILYFIVQRPYEDRPLAMSFLVISKSRMWGRYWGTREYVRNLHFYLCYYGPMKYAIEKGIRFFDPGMGSRHKVQRGFRSISNPSFHSFRDSIMQMLFSQHIHQFNAYETEVIESLNSELPFKKTGPSHHNMPQKGPPQKQ